MSIEADIGALLTTRDLTVATAESCTGGLIGHRLTSISGSSRYFKGGIIAYANEIKRKYLEVDPEVLRREGAVSEPVARQMAAGVRRGFGTDFGIATTGIAGPTGGSREKPVGLVHIAVSDRNGTIAAHFVIEGDRSTVQREAAQRAFEMLKGHLNLKGEEHGQEIRER